MTGTTIRRSDDGPDLEYGLPPISADPPLHTWTRRLLLPWFSHRRVADYVPFTRDICRRLLDQLDGRGQADAAVDYAQQIPVRVIAHVLGVPLDMSDTFTEWVREVLEFADDDEKRRTRRRSSSSTSSTQLERPPGSTPATTCSGSC